MGFSSITTIRACAGVAGELGKEYMIDLLEVPADRIRALCEVFPEAIFCIHLPSDKQGEGLVELVKSSVKELSGAKKIAVAGGVTLGMVPVLKSCGIEIGIVGSAITNQRTNMKWPPGLRRRFVDRNGGKRMDVLRTIMDEIECVVPR